MIPTIPDELSAILASTPELKRADFVGGCVRDWLLDQPSKDLDIAAEKAGSDSSNRQKI